MEKKTAQSLSSKRRARISPVIRADGVRVGTEDKVEVQAYALGERREVSTEVLEALREVHQEMLNSLEARLSLFLRAEIALSLEELTAVKYQKVSKEADPDFHLNLFHAHTATGAGFIGLDTKVALVAVNLMLGGKGDAPKEARALTKIESDLSADLANEILAEWKNLWKSTFEIDPKVYQQEKSVLNFTQCDAHTGVFYAKFKFKIRETEGAANLVYPIHMIEPVLSQLQDAKSQQKEKSQGLTAQWSPVYGNVTVQPDVRVSAGRMKIEDFLSLQPGKVVPLEDGAMDRASLNLAEQTLFRGSFGVDSGRLALSLKQKL
jgi:flagellar motor switch protein FliM